MEDGEYGEMNLVDLGPILCELRFTLMLSSTMFPGAEAGACRYVRDGYVRAFEEPETDIALQRASTDLER